MAIGWQGRRASGVSQSQPTAAVRQPRGRAQSFLRSPKEHAEAVHGTTSSPANSRKLAAARSKLQQC